jgi:hypothetical protein
MPVYIDNSSVLSLTVMYAIKVNLQSRTIDSPFQTLLVRIKNSESPDRRDASDEER